MKKHNQTNLFKANSLAQIYEKEMTPYWAYDLNVIKSQIEKLKAFDVIRYAQKTNSNIHVLKLMKQNGVFVDAVSEGELFRALKAGFDNKKNPNEIVFTADVINQQTLNLVVENKIPVNAGSIDMLEQVGKVAAKHPVWIRINPGFGHGHSQKTNTGGENSKHGIWHTQLEQALNVIKKYDLTLVGIHMHIGSGVDYGHLEQVCDAMVLQVEEIVKLGFDLEAISAGGGLSIPYHIDGAEIDTEHYFKLWNNARIRIENLLKHSVSLEIEPGRFLVAQSGILVSKVHAVKLMGQNKFVLVDAGFNDLMRPSMYGSYHAISVIKNKPDGKLEWACTEGNVEDVVVAGPLCESGDVFTQHEGGVVDKRTLPIIAVNDLLVFHDAGAYGASMSSNYNSRPLIAEYAFDNDNITCIRRKQSIDSLIALEDI
ncbi:diaminopimelate decarboxylase [Thorsellia anophelis]|uniref:Diaminopimelate decarboxylase n=1 Tax=Thorsellia anophelis DSM 18579 TaxID=1123402 RepID=A0A1H9ZH47_9GAMM|nr:diaminopimelate decarboxylase [Thorsellia anophelis]SES80151.1 diaminopimelate decarboxylase [Thorsellia anophelis DSM 18579]